MESPLPISKHTCAAETARHTAGRCCRLAHNLIFLLSSKSVSYRECKVDTATARTQPHSSLTHTAYSIGTLLESFCFLECHMIRLDGFIFSVFGGRVITD